MTGLRWFRGMRGIAQPLRWQSTLDDGVLLPFETAPFPPALLRQYSQRYTMSPIVRM